MKIAHNYLIRTFPWLGLAIFLATPLWAIEMSNGPYKITRDDVNASGQVLKDAGGSFYLTGSLGSVEATQVTGGSFKLTSGLPPIYFYPDAVKQVTPTGISISSISITWDDPRGEVPPFTMGDGSDPNYPKAFSYVVKYSSVTSLESDAAFEAASTVANPPPPQNPGTFESMEIPGLLANTSYYMSIRTYDGLEASKKGVLDHNGSYPSVSTNCFTWANKPVLLATSSWSFVPNGITPFWLTMNGRPGIITMTFEVQVARDSDFNSIVYSSRTTSDSTQASISFLPLFQMTDYYFKVRAFNGAGVPSEWSDWKDAMIPTGLPTQEAFSGQDVTRVTADWWPNECASAGSWAACLATMTITYPGWPNTAGPYFHAQLSSDSGFSPGTVSDSLTQRTTYYAFSNPPLSPNTTYWAQVQTVPEAPGGGPGNGAAYLQLGWTMSGVYPGTAGTYVAYTSSASFTWKSILGP